MRKVLFLSIFFMIYCSVPAIILYGRVVDEKIRPIREAHITVDDAEVYSDHNGDFRIDYLSEGNKVLQVSHPEFSKWEKTFYLTDDSRMSVMLKKNSEDEKISILHRQTGFYGTGGLFFVVDASVLSEEEYFVGYDYHWTEFCPPGRKIVRNTSSINIGVGIADSTEIMLSIMVTEDDVNNIISEDDVFSLKKNIFDTTDYDLTYSFISTDNNEISIISLEYSEQNILYLANLNYNHSKGKGKLDIGVNYSFDPDLSVFAEIIQDYSNDHAATAYGISGSAQEYEWRLSILDNSANDYRVYGAGFSLSF